jgi:hypothetical protein
MSNNGIKHSYEQCHRYQLCKDSDICVVQTIYDEFSVIMETFGILWSAVCML